MIAFTLTLLMTVLPQTAQNFEQRTSKSYPETTSYSSQIEEVLSDCKLGDKFDQQECEQKKKKVKKDLIGKKITIFLDDIENHMLKIDVRRKNKERFLWTPFVDLENGFGISLSTPKKLNKNGLPVFRQISMPLKQPENVFLSEIQRAVRLGTIQIQLQGQFKKSWSLKSRKSSIRGMYFKAKYYKIISVRSGVTFAEGQL